MKSRLGIKIILLVIVLLLLQVPLMMIKAQVKDRNATRQSVVNEISKSWGERQNIVGPILVVPYDTIVESQVWDSNLEKYLTKETIVHHKKIITPMTSVIDGNVDVTNRQRSIFTAPVYTASLRLHGLFDLTELDSISGTLGSPELVVLMSDLSGVMTIPMIMIKGESLHFEEGGFQGVKGIKTHLKDWDAQQQYDFQLDLKGSQRISVYPLAKNNEVNFNSNWRHPSFNGQFLPESRQVADDGFLAQWRTTSLSSNASHLVEECSKGSCKALMNSSYGVTFFEPVNQYTKSDRAAKYAVLLIISTFVTFFVLETLKATSVHPVQYLLVGLSPTIFNLLLVALSEHLSFLISYIISSAACLILLSVYARHILKKKSWLGAFMGVLIAIYTLMYFILLSEDYAFLMGSVFVFLMLAILMTVTRKVDWYELTKIPSTKDSPIT